MMTMAVAHPEETGKLGLMHLKRYWSKTLLKGGRKLESNAFAEEWNTDNTLLSVIGAGIYQVSKYLYEERPSFEEFEDWVLGLNGGAIDSEKVRLFNSFILGEQEEEQGDDYFYRMTEEDWDFWNENGYLIIKDAVPKEDAKAAVDVICEFLGISMDDPATWYQSHEALQGIMVQLFQHPVLQKNRESPKVKAVYQQLYGKRNLWLNVDKVGFNPPETASYKYRGIGLHWDVSLELPIPFGLQGILYLTDTAENQGAFTCVPGFHKKIDRWIRSLDQKVDPRQQNLEVLGAKPIAANAGDCVVWHHALPHGASPNTHTFPRFVQYLNYKAIDDGCQERWR